MQCEPFWRRDDIIQKFSLLCFLWASTDFRSWNFLGFCNWKVFLTIVPLFWHFSISDETLVYNVPNTWKSRISFLNRLLLYLFSIQPWPTQNHYFRMPRHVCACIHWHSFLCWKVWVILNGRCPTGWKSLKPQTSITFSVCVCACDD
jgi:hypothetical protein